MSFDPMACYGAYLHMANAPSDEPPRISGTKRQLEESRDEFDFLQSPDPEMLTTPSTPQIASVFLQNNVVPITFPDSIADMAIAPEQKCGAPGQGWPHKHAGLFSEEGGVKNYIESLNRKGDNGTSKRKGKEVAEWL
jgi:hypothetical protein